MTTQQIIDELLNRAEQKVEKARALCDERKAGEDVWNLLFDSVGDIAGARIVLKRGVSIE